MAKTKTKERPDMPDDVFVSRKLTPAVKDFVKGYETAQREFETQDEPKYTNPFPEGSEAHRGYEEAVYDFTQK